MNRRWRLKASQHLGSLESLNEFRASLPDLHKDAGFASLADLYSVHCALHARGGTPDPRSSSCGTFYYLLANTGYQAGNSNALDTASLPIEGSVAETQLEPVIPLSTDFGDLSVRRMSSFFPKVGGESCRHIVIAIVASDGTVVLQRLHNHVQPPEERKGAAAQGEEDDELQTQLQMAVMEDE